MLRLLLRASSMDAGALCSKMYSKRLDKLEKSHYNCIYNEHNIIVQVFTLSSR